MTEPVIVLDGEQRSSLAVVRSLGRRGCQVHVGSTLPSSLAGGSRFSATETLLPNPLQQIENYCTAVRTLAKAHGSRMVFPITEASTLALLERRDLLPGLVLPTSDLQHFRQACDKAAVLSLARTLGIDTPMQWEVNKSGGYLPDIPVEQFPVVIKPARSIVGAAGARRKTSVQHAKTQAELHRALTALDGDIGPVLVQQKIEGPGLGVFLLRWRGEVVASFAHRRIREKPPSGGVSVCCESISAPQQRLVEATMLLDHLDWSGVAMVEFKRDVKSGRDYLMEINPRFWGSLQLAIDAGVDFPWYLYQLAAGIPVAPSTTWRTGIRSRWFLGEVDHLLARLRHSRAALDLPDNAQRIWGVVGSIVVPWLPGRYNDVLRISDPRPFARELRSWVNNL